MTNQILEIGGMAIAPGQRQHLEIPVAQLPTRTTISLPVIAINGQFPGPRLWLSAAIHGDEINGVEIIRQVLERLKAKHLYGAVIAVPIVNVFGFIEQSRYLPDRRDLNRSFPGSAQGSLGSRLAHLFMTEIVHRSTHGIDLHTAAQPRINLPQIRANLADAETYRCAQAFGAPLMINATTRDGSLRQAASKQGIPTLLYETGEASRFDPDGIEIGVDGILRVMDLLKMYPRPLANTQFTSLEITQTKWVRASRSGLLHLEVKLGNKVEKKQRLGIITDAFGETMAKIRSPEQGVVIGHVQNPLVNQGDAIVNLALISDKPTKEEKNDDS
ncbi:succinylglutamate desuccinylase/aspartoacylase family protein [Crocosphaera sp. XPORK-15E]|uniref:succinylglutamate desuccinylase/aspartoacylase family protein n=1 Tax=Crocosphaera sp. XPORK-15E TaxID=3110247 RepID=UPI002B1EE75A|nr:succinylglutamate desuccinylase/aspartoacylase family protein [Crocosphaera sp. XPORK-15E]MEA5537178.1 succinylglutamate desuccinylase/aspartoacylase family protein [Crocosphaera sp. XPORK-15E]